MVNEDWMSRVIAPVNERLIGRFEPAEDAPDPEERRCLEACRYPLEAGGKRVRPALLLSMAGALGGDAGAELALPAACALESLHTYSLVHDDLPCMDDDGLRRGRPTTHKIYGEAQGLLAGDALLTEAFAWLAETRRGELIGPLARVLATRAGARGMILGQWLDLSAEGAGDSRWPELERIHSLKTGMLLAAALEMGALCGLAASDASMKAPQAPLEVTHPLVRAAGRAGMHIGLAFQVVDDILDSTASTEALGKTAGKDQAQAKQTAVRLLGLEGARARADELTQIAELELARCLENVRGEEQRRWREGLEHLVRTLLDRRS